MGNVVRGTAYADNFEEVEKFALRHGRNSEIYMGVAPRINANGNRGLKNCALPTALWIDADDEKATRAELALFELDPSIIVRSGMGLHVYWLLLGEPSGQDQVKQALRQLARRLEGDVKSAEPAHILRVPGTMNHKYRPFRPVEVEYIDVDRKYEIGQILKVTAPPSRSAAFSKGRSYMSELPPAVQGEHGDDATYRAACVLVRDLGLGEEEALELMMEWNARCVPPWDQGELLKKIRGAEAYGLNDRGAADPAIDFEEVAGIEESGFEQKSGSDKIASLMNKISAEFKSVDENGKYKAYAHRPDEILGRKYWVKYDWVNFLRVCGAVMHYGNVKIKVSDDKTKSIPAGQYWLTMHKKKITYRGIVYAPEYDSDRTPDDRLNIWTGFAVNPEPTGSWELLKKLILETLCGSNNTSYEYVINWMARAVQMPSEPGAVALVFKGPKGTGKSTLGTAFIRLFGQHGMHVTSPTLLTGRFNAHLRDISALFADEAFWAGDKTGEGILKGLVTDSLITYEGKGTNAESGRNCVHLMMASNEDWVVPADLTGERRFAVFGVENNVRDNNFWGAVKYELNNGGLKRMLYDLKTRDISDFNVFHVPQTSALAEQKVQTLRTSEAWLWDLVVHEYEDITLHEGNVALIDDLEMSIDSFYTRKRLKPSVTSLPMHLGKLIKKMIPSAVKTRILVDEKRRWGYILPSPEDAIKYIEKTLGLESEDGLLF
ncbi:MAG TPA: DUF5906 domain-containing protein [Gammaproteobacteria bacterium]|nr:DUF5906 domain-containing protein [Gammaproteobacteria bacterium]